MSLLAVTAGSSGKSVVEPEGTEFDGVTDYLSRSSDLVGNVDSKTFTFSCWVYADDKNMVSDMGIYTTDNDNFIVKYSISSDYIVIYGKNSAGSDVYAQTVRVLSGSAAINGWNHIVVSVDLGNSLAHCYVNDFIGSSVTTKVNDFVNFTNTNHNIGRRIASNALFKGRLSHLYLDYTYRDLSIEANRRIFTVDN